MKNALKELWDQWVRNAVSGFVLIVAIGLTIFFLPDLSVKILLSVLSIWFIWGPFVFGRLFIHLWLTYIRTRYVNKEGGMLLEVRLPKEILKSPEAMEIALNSFYQKGSATWIETYYKGKVRPWFSFELVSLEGAVKFYIWTNLKHKNLIEVQFYAQYPGIEILEVEDYAYAFKNDRSVEAFWGTYYQLKKDSVYPIRSYVDYGLKDNPKEEHKIDPMAQTLEFLGSMKKGEQIWIQILFQAHKKEGLQEGYWRTREMWDKTFSKEVSKILLRDPKTKGGALTDEGVPIRVTLSEGERELAAAIERNVSKTPYEVTMRGFYISKNDAFRPISVTGLINAFQQYTSANGLNSFRLGKFTDFDYPFQDFRNFRRHRREDIFLDMYRRRSFFQPPYKHYLAVPFILSVESLATIFHFPGQTAATPSVNRITSKKAEAPSNLPI